MMETQTIVLLLIVLGLLVSALGSVVEALVEAIAELARTAVTMVISAGVLALALMSESGNAQVLPAMVSFI